MPSHSSDTLVDERVAQLEVISKRRNELLREMYHMMRRRHNVGSVLALEGDDDDDDDEGDIHVFLQRFDLTKNSEMGAITNLAESELFTPAPSAVPTIHSWSKTEPIAHVKSDLVGPERRSQAHQDVKKVGRQGGSGVGSPDPPVEIGGTLPSAQHSTTKPDGMDSDDILVSVPSEGRPSRQQFNSLPYIYRDDDERDELDLIGSLSPSSSSRSMTTYERTQSTPQRSRSRSRVIHIVDSPESGELVEIEEQDDLVITSEDNSRRKDCRGQEGQIQVTNEERQVTPEEERSMLLPEDKEPAVQCMKPGIQEEEREMAREARVEDQLRSEREATLIEERLSPGEYRMAVDEKMVVLDEDPPSPKEARAIMADAPLVEGVALEKNAVVVPSGRLVTQVSADASVHEGQLLDVEIPEVGQTELVSANPTVSGTVQFPSPYIPHAPFVPGVVVGVPTVQRSIMIPTPSSPIRTLPHYDFESPSVSPSQQATLPTSPTQPRHHFRPQYTLPPLKSLPVEFNRKGKLTKQQRKREKERERIEKVSEKVEGHKEKDEWAPMCLNKWGATIRANPVWKRVARASKCLSTREWSVAMTELRLFRTLDRVELLKEGGRWSYRQPKKQRGIGGLTKTHRDYLMDEMKWMRMDFREERKWKLMLAYNVATAVLEWHAAGSLAERVARNICVLWKRPKAEEVGDVAASANDRMEIDDAPAEGTKSNTLAMVDYGSEDEDDDEIDKSVVDALEPIALVQDVLDGADGTIQNQRNQPRDDGRETVQPKIEDIDDSSALQGGQVDEAMDIDMQPFDDPTGQENNTKEEHPSPTLGLKTTSTNPVLGSKSNSRSTFGDSDISASSKPTSKPNMYAPLRELIAYSDDDKIFLAVDDLSRLQGGSAPSTEDDILKPETLPPPDLSSIFPDLHPLTLLDVVPLVVAGTLAEGKKRSEKRSDKDDPNKRAEDVTYSKLAPTGQFMYSKPTLLGPLQPAKYWKNGRWLNLDESMAVSESDSPSIRTVDENMCELFEGNKPGSSPAVNTYVLLPPQDARKRADHIWTTDDDILLKKLVDKYPNNWALICDSFNSSRVTVSTDKRTLWDCLERWDFRWGGNRLLPHATLTDLTSSVNLDGTSTLPQMTTRGVKRLASSSISSGSTSGVGESKRRRRHVSMLETIRKAAKKREATQKSNLNQRKSTAIHDTHHQYNKMPKFTPAELSRMKADKEARDNQEMILAKRRHEELARQNLLRDQAHRMQVQPNLQQAQILQQQQQQQQQQQANGVPRPAGAAVTSTQAVPQIRSQVNISQQQRIPTPMAAANTRMSPQQMIHVHAQAAQARMAAQAQAQAQNGQANHNGMNNTHLSAAYASRAATSSPAQSSPPRSSSTPSNVVNPPRPASAQSQAGMVAVPGNAIPRQAGHYFPVGGNLPAPQFTQEQMEQALRLQTMMAQHHRAGLSQAPNGSYPQT